MTGPRPSFFDSEYFVLEVDNWHLKEGAPAEIVKEFEAFMASTNPDKKEGEYLWLPKT